MAGPPKPGTPDFSTTDTSSYVKEVQAWFQLFGPEEQENFATPRYLASFLVYLRAVTDAAKKNAPAGVGAQWRLDMKRWEDRLNNYFGHVLNAIASKKIDSHGATARTVAGPLLIGEYEEPPPPGVQVDESGIGILDAVTPITLAHQAEVTRTALDDAWTQLGHDLAEAATSLPSKILRTVRTAAAVSVSLWLLLSIAGATVLAVAGGAYLALRDPAKARRGKRGA